MRKIIIKFFQKFPTTCRLLFSRSNQVVSNELVANKLAQFRSPLLILESDAPEEQLLRLRSVRAAEVRQLDPTFTAQSRAYAHAVSQSEYRSIPNHSPQQVVAEIQEFVDQVQQQIDREEFELW